jgi:tetratricopeptide (TPR) repeat protein
MSRLEQLHKLLARTPADPFLLYGIALEHKKAQQHEQAVEFLDRTIAVDAKYCYAYYQKGQVLEQMDRPDDAKAAYRAGIAAARAAGDGHAQGELQGALDLLG